MDEDAFAKRSLVDEHSHRYMLAALIASGRVVDCACGIGYGSKFLATSPRVKTYLGVDPDAGAIRVANSRYATHNVSFVEGQLEDVPCPDATVDTFVMLETLEHVADPQAALSHIFRKLTSNGLLIGSVPSKDYELLCEQAYSPNPYHIQRFTPDDIHGLLRANFADCRLLGAEYVLGTLLRELTEDQSFLSKGEISFGTRSGQQVLGSIFFLAGSVDAVGAAMERLAAMPKFLVGAEKASIDMGEVRPVYRALEATEEMVRSRDHLLESQTKVLEERWEILQAQAARIDELEKTASAQTALLEERWSAMQKFDEMVAGRDRAIATQAQHLEERWAEIKKLEGLIGDRDRTIAAHAALLLEHQQAVAKTEAMVVDRDKAIAGQAKLLEERWAMVEKMESAIAERDRAIVSQAELLEKRWELIANLESSIRNREETMSGQERRIAALEEVTASQGELLERLTREKEWLVSKLDFIESRRVIGILRKLRLLRTDHWDKGP